MTEFDKSDTGMEFEMIGLRICGLGHGCHELVCTRGVAAPQ